LLCSLLFSNEHFFCQVLIYFFYSFLSFLLLRVEQKLKQKFLWNKNNKSSTSSLSSFSYILYAKLSFGKAWRLFVQFLIQQLLHCILLGLSFFLCLENTNSQRTKKKKKCINFWNPKVKKNTENNKSTILEIYSQRKLCFLFTFILILVL